MTKTCCTLLLALLLPGLLLACNEGAAPPAPEASGPALLGPEDVAVVESGTLFVGPRVLGALEPREQARVRAEVGGEVIEVNVELGEAVEEGQVLGRLEAGALGDALTSANAALSSAQEQHAVASRQVARTERLVEAGALAPNDLEQARASQLAAKAQLDAARAQLSRAREQSGSAIVRSPMLGLLSERAVNAGDVVVPGAPLFTVIDLTTLRLRGSVPTESLETVAPGTPVHFRVRGFGERTFTGEIERLAPMVDATTGQLTVLITIPNPEARPLAGLFAEGRIGARSATGQLIPLAAIGDVDGSNASVTLLEEGEVTRRAVTVSLTDPSTDRAVVTGALETGGVLLLGEARELPAGTAARLLGGVEVSEDDERTLPPEESGDLSSDGGRGLPDDDVAPRGPGVGGGDDRSGDDRSGDGLR